MIVKMKKVTLMLLDSEKEKSLKALEEAGVVHLTDCKGSSEKLSKLMSKRDRVLTCFNCLDNLRGEYKKRRKHPSKEFKIEGDNVIENVTVLLQKEKDLVDSMIESRKEMGRIISLGNFSPFDIDYIAKSDLFLKLFRIDAKLEEDFLTKCDAVRIKKEKKMVLFVALLESKETQVEGYEAIEWPFDSLEVLRENIENSEMLLENIREELIFTVPYIKEVEKKLAKSNEEIRYEEVYWGVSQDERIVYFTGYIPQPKLKKFKRLAEEHGWGLMVETPSLEDEPPTLIENKGPGKLAKPIFEFLGTVPGYTEYDISFFFFLFLSIFTGMIIGDAGYGSILLTASLLGFIFLGKKGSKVRTTLGLFTVLSLATIIWGALTGNWFGSLTLANVPQLKQLVIPAIAAFPEVFPGLEINPQVKIMYICFGLGIVQIGLACIQNVIRDFPKLKFLSQLGWFAINAGMYFVVLNFVLRIDLPWFVLQLIVGGLALVVFFGAQEKGQNFFLGIAKGFAGLFTTILDTISCFANIVSYIRLFAVGLATVAVASSFNAIAAPLMGETVGYIAAVLVLLIGHSLNLVMGLLSVIVHGIRLNMLEYSGQLGMEWTGENYEPFACSNK